MFSFVNIWTVISKPSMQPIRVFMKWYIEKQRCQDVGQMIPQISSKCYVGRVGC